MNKSQKKIDKEICRALTRACEMAKVEVPGFQWLTHFVNYQQFPQSLSIVCIFGSHAELAQARQEMTDQLLSAFIAAELQKIDINFKHMQRPVAFDTEEACRVQSHGNWPVHFKKSRYADD
ncbi:MAG: hypothetical protein ABGX40_07020 [Methylococcales bacterium]|jgi:hypothetical protein|nr:Fis family transcriptional regulator [Methylococcaceae bacterium]